jgi:hypothetical protein
VTGPAPAPYGTRKRGVAMLPLAIILALHVLLVLLWPITVPVHSDRGAEQRFLPLAWFPALKRPVPPPARAVRAAARVGSVHAALAPSAPQPAPSTAAEPVPSQEMPQQSSKPAAPEANRLTDIAKRQAGAVDRELRGGKLAPLTPDPDLPIHRFRRALESAYIDQSRTLVTDSYTQPDGVIVYRFRLGSKVWCRQSGGGTPGMLERSEGAKLAGAGSAGGAGAAGTVQCPGGDSGWSRR